MPLTKKATSIFSKAKKFIEDKGGWDDAYEPLTFAYANLAADVIRLTEELESEGLTIEGADGPKRNPKEMVRNAAFASMLSAAKELGITRVAEYKLETKTAEVKKADPIASLRRIS